MKAKKGRWYEGQIGKNTVHRFVEELAVKMGYGPIPGEVVVMYRNEKSGTKGMVRKDVFEKWAKQDVTDVYVGYNKEYGVTE